MQLNVRVPVSAREDLRRLVEELRRRRNGGGRSSLPEQDLVTFAIWMLGDPADEVALEELGRQYAAFRKEQLRDHAESVPG